MGLAAFCTCNLLGICQMLRCSTRKLQEAYSTKFTGQAQSWAVLSTRQLQMPPTAMGRILVAWRFAFPTNWWASCAVVSEPGLREPRLCDYNGHYYCNYCHWSDAMVIPARIIANWDFQPRKVVICDEVFLHILG